jgi:hypothetical protein
MDGAPAIFFGKDHEIDEYFIATKSILNKQPVKFFSEEQISARVDDLHLRKKLLRAFPYVHRLKPNCIVQGDFLFTDDEVFEFHHDDKIWLGFQPNKILYAQPMWKANYQKDDIGIYWHTVYDKQLNPSYGVNVADVFNDSDVRIGNFFSSPSRIRFDPYQIQDIKVALANLYKTPSNVLLSLDTIHNQNLSEHVLKIMNRCIREQKLHTKSNVVSAADAYFHEEAMKRKTPLGKGNVVAIQNKLMPTLQNSASFYDMLRYIGTIKTTILNALDKQEFPMKTFLVTNDNDIVETRHEGYVMYDSILRRAFKIVDQLTFSYANFSDEFKRGYDLK